MNASQALHDVLKGSLAVLRVEQMPNKEVEVGSGDERSGQQPPPDGERVVKGVRRRDVVEPLGCQCQSMQRSSWAPVWVVVIIVVLADNVESCTLFIMLLSKTAVLAEVFDNVIDEFDRGLVE
jgi:hypothetical protein